MIYRLYVETESKGNGTAWAFAFYNHQDFRIYKLIGKSESGDEKEVVLSTTARALTYFSNFIRRRYYDEHFATILDEDNVTVFTQLADLEKAKKRFPADDAGYAALWTQMKPFLERPTMFFASTPPEDLLAGQTRALLE
ncbi:MAG: hypothetical protein IJU41_02600 [Clostridia bacterium]|nr:hypothetical protein [Clostridia bacterium]